MAFKGNLHPGAAKDLSFLLVNDRHFAGSIAVV
jgi:hypothetical protein